MKLMFIEIAAESIAKLRDSFETAGLELLVFDGPQDQLYPLIKAECPDIILINTNSASRDTLEQRTENDRKQARTVISLGRQSQSINRLASEAGLSLYASDQVSVQLLQALIDITLCQLLSRDKLASEIANMAPALEQQRILLRGVDFIMRSYGLAENQARDLLLKNAKHQRRSPAELAKQLVETGSLA